MMKMTIFEIFRTVFTFLLITIEHKYYILNAEHFLQNLPQKVCINGTEYLIFMFVEDI